MGDILQFRRPKAAEKHKGNTLCRSGFHKWQVDKNRVFDVRQGRLVTVFRCMRCSEEKRELV